MSSEGEARLERVIAPVCAADGLRLYDVEIRAGICAVAVDADGGPDLEQIAAVAKAISAALDADETLGPDGNYELEVGSPGLERRLRRPEHFAAVLGQRIALRTRPGIAGERRATGTLEAADGDGIVIVADGGGSRHLSYDALERAHTVFDFAGALRTAKTAAQRDEVVAS